ncbi:MAG TPA: hypothetical protein P5081_08515 [Phycisphaerae bacterium]|nr:hypothetical protein [Phycisphaerae bacterium]HRW52916.1 hypothetical protein [Phycisphaerae bacterium]
MTTNVCFRAVALCALILTTGAGARPLFAQCDHLNPPVATDAPDDAFDDSNNDGIDGMACGPIFVSPLGDDRNLGTIDAPMKTLGAAVLAARWFSPPRSVYVASTGVYSETLIFVDGVNVYAGYDDTLAWSRGNAKAIIEGGQVATRIAGPTPALTLDRLTINAADNLSPGGLSVGLLADPMGGTIELRHCEIFAGAVSNGQSGGMGAAGVMGGQGGNGLPGTCDGSPFGTGGAGGSSPAGNIGGMGGRGGAEGANNGVMGGPGVGTGGGQGGSSGAGGSVGGPGGPGMPGGVGANGVNGAGGATFYAAGGTGSQGASGAGGGGGGGGGGQNEVFAGDGSGNGGGGGGGGGSGGQGGAGGGQGGSSYGVLATDAVINATDCFIQAANGATGGAGGVGGVGGPGGPGGPGAAMCIDEIGRGGNGGVGGAGGNGGHGGGGVGGNSIAVLREHGATLNAMTTTLVTGSAGTGGASAGINGADGVAAQDFDWAGETTVPAIAAPTATYALIVTNQDQAASPVMPLVADDAAFAHTFTITTLAAHGAAGVAGNLLTYSPQPGYFGADSFGFRATRNGSTEFVDGIAVVVVQETACVGPENLDFNCDGVVDGLDIQIFVNRLLE